MASSNTTIVSDESDPDPPKKSPDIILSRLNLNFEESKVEQILRLVKDQEELNKRLKERTLYTQATKSDSDETLSDSSVKETEKRLSQRLSIHRQKGGRSCTSMGFYNDKKITHSSDEDDSKMTDDDRMMNTRINRPKSSYVRRRHAPTEEVNTNVDTTAVRRCRSTRPPSRIGIRDSIKDTEEQNQDFANNHAREYRKSVLKETTFNVQVPPSSPRNEVVDSTGYDRYAHTKTPVPVATETGIHRERTDLRSTRHSENYVTESGYSKAQYEKQIRNRQREDTVSDIPTRRRHRRQQYNNIRASRPTSENVYLVRQRTEARLLKNNSTSKLTNRPKSDRLMISSSGSKPVLSIDHNPVNNSTLNYQKNSVQTQNNTLDYQTASRPMSRRGRAVQEVTNRSSGVISSRPPLSLMKLPPLDPSVSKRPERMVLTTARETCV